MAEQRLGQQLNLKQQQSLAITPQLQQSLKILQCSHLELAEEIAQELEKNPLLSLGETEDEKPADNAENSEQPIEHDETEIKNSREETLPEEDYGNMWTNDDSTLARDKNNEAARNSTSEFEPRINDTASRYEGEGRDFDRILSREKTLREHLLEQINVDMATPFEKVIASHLTDALDDAGYITADYTTIAKQLGCKVQEVEAVLEKLQACDPPGIFARSLQECLALQLRDQGRLDPAMQALLDNLELLAVGNVVKLQKLCGVDEEDIRQMADEIRTLNPKPGASFEHETLHATRADVFVTEKKDGSGWMVELNPETLPKVVANRNYYAELTAKTTGYDKKYISEQWQSANFLVKALQQRADTLLRVASELVSQQHEFFQKGVYHLKPLVYRDVAEVLEMHESTIGRAVANKFMHTPRGLFEMKYFFTSGVKGHVLDGDLSDGAGVSSEAVKRMIQELIATETPAIVYSDDKIAEMLAEKGIDVARRTVTKYREAMHIASSVERRRQHKSLFRK